MPLNDYQLRYALPANELHARYVVAQVRLAPQERFEMELALAEGAYRVRGPQLPFVVGFRAATRGVVGRWELPLSRPTPPELVPILKPHSQVIVLTNDTPQELLVRVERTASRRDALTAASASSLSLFREMFPDEVLSPGQMASVTSVTLLLVRAYESAELYRRLGDGSAFSLIRQLFGRVEAEVASHGGAVVKIVGDGVVASFGDPLAAVRTALELLAEANRISGTLPLQMAVHRGPAMVATLNGRLDYFGHCVHVVHQLLDRCGPDELLLTDAMAGLPDVFSMLRERQCQVEILATDNSSLDAIVHRCRTPSASCPGPLTK